ncbi:hypothetical protein GOODEAATRI_023916, partial [Goodea atripinnis]
VMQNQTAGFGSEQFCDLDGFSPLGLDTDTGCPVSPVQSHCDGLHTCQFSVRDSDPTGWLKRGKCFNMYKGCFRILKRHFQRIPSIWNMFFCKLHQEVSLLFLCFKRLDCKDYLCVQLLPEDTFQFASIIHITKAS